MVGPKEGEVMCGNSSVFVKQCEEKSLIDQANEIECFTECVSAHAAVDVSMGSLRGCRKWFDMAAAAWLEVSRVKKGSRTWRG